MHVIIAAAGSAGTVSGQGLNGLFNLMSYHAQQSQIHVEHSSSKPDSA